MLLLAPSHASSVGFYSNQFLKVSLYTIANCGLQSGSKLHIYGIFMHASLSHPYQKRLAFSYFRLITLKKH